MSQESIKVEIKSRSLSAYNVTVPMNIVVEVTHQETVFITDNGFECVYNSQGVLVSSKVKYTKITSTLSGEVINSNEELRRIEDLTSVDIVKLAVDRARRYVPVDIDLLLALGFVK